MLHTTMVDGTFSVSYLGLKRWVGLTSTFVNNRKENRYNNRMKMTKAEREAAESFHHWATTAIEYKKTRIAKQQKQDEIDNESYAMVDNLNIVLAPLDIASWDHVIWCNGDANELECSTGDIWLKDPRKVAIRAVTEIRALRAYIAKQAKELEKI